MNYKDSGLLHRGSWLASLFGFLRVLTFNFSPPAPSHLVHKTAAVPCRCRHLLRARCRPETPSPSTSHSIAGIRNTSLHARCTAPPLSSHCQCDRRHLRGALPWYALHTFPSRRAGANPARPVPTHAPCLCLTLPRYPCSFRMPAKAASALTSLLPACSRKRTHHFTHPRHTLLHLHHFHSSSSPASCSLFHYCGGVRSASIDPSSVSPRSTYRHRCPLIANFPVPWQGRWAFNGSLWSTGIGGPSR